MNSYSQVENNSDQTDIYQSQEISIELSTDILYTNYELSANNAYDLFKIISKSLYSNYPVTKTVGSSVLIAGFGLATASPYIQTARLFAKGNIILEYMLPAGESVALGFLNTWLLKDILSTFQQPISKDHSCGIKTALLVCPTILGAGTSLPSVLISLSYNNMLWLTGFAFLGDLVSNTYSFNRIAHNLIHHPYPLAQEMSDRLRLGLYDVINLSDEKIQRFVKSNNIEHLYNPDMLPNDHELSLLMKDLIMRGCQLKAKRDHYAKCYHNRTRTFVTYGVSALLPFTWVPAAFTIVFDDMKVRITNRILAGVVSVSTTAPLYLLVALLGKRLVDDIWDTIADLYSGTFKKSFAQRNYPTLLMTLSALALIFAGFSFGTTSLVLQEKFPGVLGQILVPLVSSILVSIRAYALLKTIDEVILYCASSIGSHEEMAKFTRLIQTVADNLPNLPQESVENLSLNLKFPELAVNETCINDEFKQMVQTSLTENDVIVPYQIQVDTKEEKLETPLVNRTHGSWFSFWKQATQAEDVVDRRCRCTIL